MTEVYDINSGIVKRRIVDGVWVPFQTENDPETVEEYIQRIQAFLPGWTNVAIYTQPGSIDGDLYDHPVKITIPYNSSYMRSDFGDIRFSTVDRQLLDYHIESKTNGVTATFVVKVPYLPKSPGATEILVYAGKSNATTTSNPDSVYLFSDYATGKYEDKWVNVNGSGSYGIVSGKQAIKLNSATTNIKNSSILEWPFQIEAYLLASAILTQIQYCQDDSPTTNEKYYARIDVRTGNYGGIRKDGSFLASSQITSTANTWVKVKLTVDENGFHTLYFDDVLVCQAKDTTYKNGRIVLNHHNSGTGAVAELRISPYTENPPATGSLGDWETSRLVTDTIELAIHGTVFGENPESPLPAASFGVTVILADGEYTNLTGFSIDKDKSSSTFEVDISSQEDELFMTGQEVLINKYTGGSSKKLYFGIVDDVTDNQSNAKREYAIKGHGLSQQLVKDGFTWVCSGGKIKKTVKPAKTIISNYILSGTDIEMGPGVDLNLNITNYSKAASGWCGSFDTKKAAIDSLLSLVSEYAGKVVNWFIDKDGKFRTFYGEDRDNDLGIVITDTNPRIISLGVGENSENIVNKITGYYGKKGQYSITLQNNDSIYGWTDDEGIEHPGYGICKGEDITNKDITKKSTMQRKLQMILNRLSMPIFDVELELARYPEIEVGQPLYLPDRPRVNQETFIVSKVKIGKNSTKISATTDLNSVSPPSEYQSVRVVAEKAVSKSAPKTGTITEVDGEVYVIQLDSGGTTLNVNDLS
jgi:hypothetical protein